MKLVLLVGLGFTIKIPGHLGSGAPPDGGGDPDGVASTDAEQVICCHINADGWRNCTHGYSGENIKHKEMTKVGGKW